ncbi:hypothetical protein Hbl1158_10220 [Halobaculum sp. CBA1158]|uniref:hypothetical protein n=1 Tax=Halobaculum sp. CBA1158 TaxID=2904243 RepID=UPI001F31B0A4|nr:hypothetical protein [Halobaculum sp. CBA1158]UIO98909.1 hypothetical protein Hbl1158_10220 [Halobaculum sp. CBA1158]
MAESRLFVVREQLESGESYNYRAFDTREAAADHRETLEAEWRDKYTLFDSRGERPIFRDNEHGNVFHAVIERLPYGPPTDE